jgi:hypothetical protein
VASAAAVAAVVSVVGAGTLAGVQYAAREPASAGATTPTSSGSVLAPSAPEVSPSVFPGGQLVFGDGLDNAVLEVPRSWRIQASSEALRYSGGGGFAEVVGPALLDPRWCKDRLGHSPRAWVGFDDAVVDQDVRAANQTRADEWQQVLTGSRKKPKPVTQEPAVRIRLADGTEAWRTVLRTTASACGADRRELSLTSFDTGDAVATVIGLRYSGFGGELPAATMNRIVGTAQVQRPG